MDKTEGSFARKLFSAKTAGCLAAATAISACVTFLRLKNFDSVFAETEFSAVQKILFALCDGFFISGVIFGTAAALAAVSRMGGQNAFSAIAFGAKTFAKRLGRAEQRRSFSTGEKREPRETYFEFVRKNEQKATGSWQSYLATAALFLALSGASLLLLQRA